MQQHMHPFMDGPAAMSRREEEASIRSTTPETRQASFLSSRMEATASNHHELEHLT
jgi:hypothetical protein